MYKTYRCSEGHNGQARNFWEIDVDRRNNLLEKFLISRHTRHESALFLTQSSLMQGHEPLRVVKGDMQNVAWSTGEPRTQDMKSFMPQKWCKVSPMSSILLPIIF